VDDAHAALAICPLSFFHGVQGVMSVPHAFAMAWEHHQAGRLGHAELLYRQILELDANQVDALHNLAMIAMQRGSDDLALEYLQAVLRLKPDYALAHNNLGNVQVYQRQLAKAVASYRQAVGLKPDFAEAYNNLGMALREQGELQESVACLQRAVRLKPDYAEARNNLALALRNQEKLVDADQAAACNQKGLAFIRQGRQEEAAACWRQALARKPDYPEAHSNLANVLLEQGKPDEAAMSLQEALRHKPDYPEAHNNLGNVLLVQGKLDEAAASYRQAVHFHPRFADAHNNLGNVLRCQGNLAEAVLCFEQAVRLKPDFAEAHSNLGMALQTLGKLPEALGHFEQALHLRPDYAGAHLNRGLHWLLLGNWEQGWPEYEWRWRVKDFPSSCRPGARWDGSPLHGQTILLSAEQGLGDTLQFIRYAAMVKEHGGTVVAECHADLLGVLAGCAGIDQLLPQGGRLPAYDVQAPLLSLPGLFGTTLATIPAEVPYLVAERARVSRWRDRLATVAGFKVGICWQGNPGHQNDRWRSVPLAQFGPLAEVPGLRLVSLQKGPGREQWTTRAAQWPVVDLPDQEEEPSEGWMETAALMCALDLVITVDTAIAHLAGALAVPVWVALPFIPDWRWLLGRENSLWYPTMRLFRQTRHDHWADVFERMAAELRRAR
jgi:tetratricopeptide (TPR) repeat protein